MVQIQFFFNKNKKKDWTFRTLANPHPLTSDNISFLPRPPSPIPLKVNIANPLGLVPNEINFRLENYLQKNNLN